jgi:hypothetical protein
LDEGFIVTSFLYTGYKATIEELIGLEKKASGQAMKERIRSQIRDSQYVFVD